MFGSGTTTLIISNEKMKDIMKIVNYLKEFSYLIKEPSKTTENESKEKKSGFLSTLFGTLIVRKDIC